MSYEFNLWIFNCKSLNLKKIVIKSLIKNYFQPLENWLLILIEFSKIWVFFKFKLFEFIKTRPRLKIFSEKLSMASYDFFL